MDKKLNLSQRWAEYRPTKGVLAWSCVACIAGTMIVGFTWGGWVTGGSARAMAASSANDARSQLAAALCVDRFQAAEDAVAQLERLRGVQSWGRRDFIEKGGWTTMPGASAPATQAAALCAEKLLAAGAVQS
jgi:hypothetical protein